MFEFRVQYFEPGYHKEGDEPFRFPPQGTESFTKSNLVEIRGKNGTGKTTLLNILALALGYLDRESELQRKPILKAKLSALDRNPTLEYDFRITRQDPFPIDLKLQRNKGQKPRVYVNSKAVAADTLARDFDVVFLTEDDPAKVISAGLGKLSHYFASLDDRLNSINATLNRHAVDNTEYRDFKQKEFQMELEIQNHKQDLEKNRQKLALLEQRIKAVESKDSIKSKLELLSSRAKIEADFKDLQAKHQELSEIKDVDISDKIFREKIKFAREMSVEKDNASRVIQICDSLAQYQIQISPNRLLEHDYSELNDLKKTLVLEGGTDPYRTEMVEDFIDLLQRYRPDSVVPVFERPVRDILMDFYKLKSRQASDRVRGLVQALDQALAERNQILDKQEKTQARIEELSKNRRDLERIDKIAREYAEAEKRYLNLQAVLQEDRQSLLSTWEQVKSVSGDPQSLRSEFETINAQARIDESLMTRTAQKLTVLKENASKKPEFFDKDQRLESVRLLITGLREKMFHWGRILINPGVAREQFEAVKGRPGFGLSDYRKFVEAVGQYLGDQFEPVAFDNKMHGIKFLDIESNSFTTDDGRRIPIQSLSQGQSKTTTITGSFKQMGQDKTKLVLVDEIADLDPDNLRNVRRILSEKFNSGSLLLALLVRPTDETAGTPVRIAEWG
jgi:ABC-type transport system involved in cytochrome c biogenesis ATPase subunit